ncbi:MAG: 23S rRNA (guanosine(2251)-2'-O)-methyltransferase RlmB [Bacteroidota bacterium]
MSDDEIKNPEENNGIDDTNFGNKIPSTNRYLQDRKPLVDLIAGRQPVTEALKSGKMIEKVVLLFGVKGNAIEKIKMLAKQNRIPFVEVGKQRFRELVNDTTTQGVVAIIGTKKYVEVEDILKLAKERNEQPFMLILDEIEDPHNLGALIRSAECAGMHGVIIPKHHAVTVNQTVVKTSAGASEHMMVAKVVNIAQTIDELKSKKIWMVGGDAAAPKTYTEIDLNMPLAIVIGSEGSGIRRLVKEKCDFLVKIPLYGKVQALNASVAGALMMFEAVRQRKQLGVVMPSIAAGVEIHSS